MKFLKQTPLLRIAVAYIVGIVMYQIVVLPPFATILLLSVGVCGIVADFSIKNVERKYRTRWLFGASIMTIFLTIGYLNCKIFEQKHSFSDLNGSAATYLVEITSPPSEKSRSTQCEVKLIARYDDQNVPSPTSGNAIIYIGRDSTAQQELLIGDYILIHTQFNSPSTISGTASFDYARYLQKRGILATAYVLAENLKRTDISPHITIKRLANISQNYLLNIYREYGIKDANFALLAGITLGYTDEIDITTKDSFSKTGASHILAISGLHIGIVYAVMMFLLGFMNKTERQKRYRAAIITIFIWAFAFITGFSPAIIRATIMMTFISIGTCFAVRPQIFNTIFASAFIILLFNPNLLFNVGFLLSYSAVISIVFYQKRLVNLLYFKNKFLHWAWELLVVSIAAQIGTMPISIYFFNQFPNYFILINLVAIPLTSVIIYSAVFLLSTSPIPILAKAIAYILNLSLSLMIGAINTIASLPHSFTVIGITSAQMILMFAFILFLTIFFILKHYKSLVASLMCLIVFFGIFSANRLQSLTQSQLVVQSTSKASSVNLISPESNLVFTTDAIESFRVSNSYWVKNQIAKPTFHKIENNFISFNNKKILILSEDFAKQKESTKLLEIDYLIVTNKVRSNLKDLLQCIKPKKIIVDNTISTWYRNSIKESCKAQDIECYTLNEHGSYLETFPH